MIFRVFLTICTLSTLHGVAKAHHKDTFNYIDQAIPVIPPMARNSGYCCMIYDIDPNGKVRNPKVEYCSEDYFAKPSLDAIFKWLYETKRKDGSPVEDKNLTSKLQFNLMNQFGFMIPGRNGYMTKLPSGEYNREMSCGNLVS